MANSIQSPLNISMNINIYTKQSSEIVSKILSTLLKPLPRRDSCGILTPNHILFIGLSLIKLTNNHSTTNQTNKNKQTKII